MRNLTVKKLLLALGAASAIAVIPSGTVSSERPTGNFDRCIQQVNSGSTTLQHCVPQRASVPNQVVLPPLVDAAWIEAGRVNVTWQNGPLDDSILLHLFIGADCDPNNWVSEAVIVNDFDASVAFPHVALDETLSLRLGLAHSHSECVEVVAQ